MDKSEAWKYKCDGSIEKAKLQPKINALGMICILLTLSYASVIIPGIAKEAVEKSHITVYLSTNENARSP